MCILFSRRYMLGQQTYPGDYCFSSAESGTRTWRGKQNDRGSIQKFGEAVQKTVPKKGGALVKLDSRNVESTKRFSTILFHLCPMARLLIIAQGFLLAFLLVLSPFSLLRSELSEICCGHQALSCV